MCIRIHAFTLCARSFWRSSRIVWSIPMHIVRTVRTRCQVFQVFPVSLMTCVCVCVCVRVHCIVYMQIRGLAERHVRQSPGTLPRCSFGASQLWLYVFVTDCHKTNWIVPVSARTKPIQASRLDFFSILNMFLLWTNTNSYIIAGAVASPI